MSRESLLTGRELVATLAEAGLGSWSPDAVRQWIREEPACPIAQAADQGKPHRYRLVDVLTWLRARAQAERAKGFTSRSGEDVPAKIEAVLARLQATSSTDFKLTQQEGEKIGASTPPPSGAGAQAEPTMASEVSHAKQQTEWLNLTDADALIEVLRNRDPRTWKAAEEAMAARRERLLEDKKLIAVEELDEALQIQTDHLVTNIQNARLALKSALRDFLQFEQVAPAERIVDEYFDLMSENLASANDIEPFPVGQPPAAAA